MNDAEKSRIDQAVSNARNDTTGRVVVRIVPDTALDAFERATAEFQRAGLHESAHRNTALVLVAPQARRFAVIGDKHLHERVGDGFWTQVVEEMRPFFARDAFADGIVHGVTRIGEALRKHFPAGPA